ncbi:MAG: HesA/MoeB/ThiF family protein [Bacillota bacterium]
MELREDQLARYSRHIALKEVGVAGQLELLQAKVLVVGAGGLGSPVAYYLAAAGIGQIGIVDNDVVDLSNLNRQVLYGQTDIGHVKVNQAKKRLEAINPDVTVIPYSERFNINNAEVICQGYDAVIDCLDNFATRFVLNDACLKFQIPLVHAGVYKYFGQILTIVPGQGPCLRCIYPESKSLDKGAPSCSRDGILGVVPGILGTLQVMEVIKLLLNVGKPNSSSILYFDGLNLSFDRIKVQPRPDCICRK